MYVIEVCYSINIIQFKRGYVNSKNHSSRDIHNGIIFYSVINILLKQ